MPDSMDTRPTPDTLGATLIAAGTLTAAALERAQRLQATSGERLETVLTRLGLVSERDLAETLGRLLGLAVVTSDAFPAAPLFEEQLSRTFLKHARLLPIAERADAVVIAMADPLDDAAAEAVRFAVDKPVVRCVAGASDIAAACERLYGDGRSPLGQLLEATGERPDDGAEDDIERLRDSASEAPVVRLVNRLIASAVEARASDIHIEPMDDQLRVRYRIDGVLQEMEPPPPHLRAAIVSRLKIMARLNIAERRLAQDGRFVEAS